MAGNEGTGDGGDASGRASRRDGLADRSRDHSDDAAPRPGPGDLVRSALADDKDPRLPWWLPLPGLAVALAWSGWEGVVAGGTPTFVSTLLWPGSGVFVLTTIATYFGWQLDID
ncbi:MAG: hypothetical protein QF664_05325 [Dehalococcoidia bacterium]|jgi:hypothetical protein|nr:hypothetical protein [Dehalococcoidia bacterium]